MVDRVCNEHSEMISNELLAALEVEAADLGAAMPVEERTALGGALRRLAILISHRIRANITEELLDADRDLATAEHELRPYGAVGALVIARASARVGDVAAAALRRVARSLCTGDGWNGLATQEYSDAWEDSE